MIEIIIGMGAAIVLLFGLLLWQVRRSAKLAAERDSMEAALDSIGHAHDAIDEVIAEEEVKREENDSKISGRTYFSD